MPLNFENEWKVQYKYPPKVTSSTLIRLVSHIYKASPDSSWFCLFTEPHTNQTSVSVFSIHQDSIMLKSKSFGVRESQIHILAWALASWMPLDSLLNPSIRFFIYKMGTTSQSWWKVYFSPLHSLLAALGSISSLLFSFVLRAPLSHDPFSNHFSLPSLLSLLTKNSLNVCRALTFSWQQHTLF